MKIQVNTDTPVFGREDSTDRVEAEIAGALARFESRLTRVEVHLSRQSTGRTTGTDFRCMIEARPRGRGPLAVTHHATTAAEALLGSIDRLVALLTSTFGRLGSVDSKETIRGRGPSGSG